MTTKNQERTELISFRLTPEEHRRLLADAERMYLPLSSYIRHKLFAGERAKPKRRRR